MWAKPSICESKSEGGEECLPILLAVENPAHELDIPTVASAWHGRGSAMLPQADSQEQVSFLQNPVSTFHGQNWTTYKLFQRTELFLKLPTWEMALNWALASRDDCRHKHLVTESETENMLLEEKGFSNCKIIFFLSKEK